MMHHVEQSVYDAVGTIKQAYHQ